MHPIAKTLRSPFIAQICCAMALCLGLGSLNAQSVRTTLSGTITDPSQAVIQNAKIEARNQSTGLVSSATTDPNGEFLLVNLDPGVYTVTATAAGFSKVEQKDVPLLAREDVHLNLRLEVGSAAGTTVEVVAPLVSESLTTSDSKSGETITSLALNFRATANPSPIAVSCISAGTQCDAAGNITISGQLPTATSFSLDGVSTQLPRYGGPTRDLFPSVENIAELRVNTSGNSAEFAQPTDVTVISKSGTNDFHGGGYWYFQRQDFNSVDQIAKIIPTGDADNFGFLLGGPVWLGKLYNGKNKTFFFFDYEGVRLDSNTLISTTTPPTPWRSGDLSGAGSTILGLDGKPLPGNKIPASQINSSAAKLLTALFPAATTSAANTNAPNLVQAFPGNYTLDGFDGRLDHNFSSNHRVWGRVSQKTISSIGTDAALGAGGAGDTAYNPLMGSFSTSEDLINVAASWNWIIRPSVINELRFGYSRANFLFSYPQAQQGDALVKDAGILGLPGPPKNGLGGTPVLYLGDFLGGQTNPYGHPRLNKNTTVEIGDNVSWIYHSHSIKFGGEFRRLSYQDNITFNLGDEYGDYFYNGNNAQAFTTFLLGRIDDAVQAQNGPDGKPFGYHWGLFAQDSWRIRRNFTLTFGLRWEVNTPFDDSTNQLGNFDRKYPGGRLVIQNNEANLVNPLWRQAVGNTPFVTASQVGLPNTLRYTRYLNFQPRLGFAWTPDDKTSIRASAGRYSVPVLGAVLYSLLGVDTSYYADYGTTSFPNAFPTGAGSAAAYPGYRRANQYDLNDPTVWQWNLSVDRQIGWKTVLKAGYTGSHTYNLIYSPDLNQVAPNTIGYANLVATPELRQKNLKYPNFREVLTRDNGPSAKYEALTLEAERRFSQDLSFNLSYVLAWNKTNALGTAPSSAIPTGGQGDNGNNVNNYYNIAADTGNAYYTPRNRFVGTFVYDLPFGRGKKYMGDVSRATNLLVGGWRVTGILVSQTGRWLTPYFPSRLADPSGTAPSTRSVKQQRPDCVSGKSGYLSNPTTAVYFDASAFTIPASNIGRYGNCGVGILEGPATNSFSMSTGKAFALTERISLRYEAQFANLFNTLNQDAPNMNVASGSFGRISQSQLANQAGPRTIQMQLRLQF